MEMYDVEQVWQAYYSRLTTISTRDDTRFKQLVAALERAQPKDVNEYNRKSYGILLLEMIEEGRLEEFEDLFPLINFDRSPYDVHLLLLCAGDKAPFAEVIYARGLDARKFVDETMDLLDSYDSPNDAIDVIQWLAERDRTIRAQKEAIYTGLIFKTLDNREIDEEERAEVVLRLVRLGAVVEDYLVRECRRALPDNEELHRFLRRICILPDIEDPDLA
jgi:hypothetical protein